MTEADTELAKDTVPLRRAEEDKKPLSLSDQANNLRMGLLIRLQDEGKRVKPTWKEVIMSSGIRHRPRFELTTEIQDKDGKTVPVTITAMQNDKPEALFTDGIEIDLNGRSIILPSKKVMTRDPKTVPLAEDIQLLDQVYTSLGPAKQKGTSQK